MQASLTTEIRVPNREMCDDLRVDVDKELGDTENVCTVTNQQLRLYVAGWMLSDGTEPGDRRGLQEARALYEGCGRDLLDRPGRLTTAQIVAEVMMMR